MTKILDTGMGILYGIAKPAGFFISRDGGRTWVAGNKGLPARVVYPYRKGEVKDLTALSFDCLDPKRVAVTTSYGLFVSDDGGESFDPVSLKSPLKATSYLTSVAIAPGCNGTYLLGTSFSGLYETRDNGYSWTNLIERAGDIKQGAGFFEEIAGCAYSPSGAEIFFALGFGKGLFRYDRKAGSLEKIPFPGEGEEIGWIGFSSVGEEAMLVVSTVEAVWGRTRDTGGNFIFVPLTRGFDAVSSADAAGPAPPSGLPTFSRIGSRTPASADSTPASACSGRTGIYIGAASAGARRITSFLDFLNAQSLDSIVIDMKDDTGFVTYDTTLEMPKRIGAVSPSFKLNEVVALAHARGIYVIGRIVVFKDRQLYQYDGNAYAVWDKKTDRPWANLLPNTNASAEGTALVQKEFWVDPYCEEVWEYNIAIAEELQRRGVDEIQFDYIRFPSDGDLATISYRHRKPGMGKSEAIESFLSMARERITVPISTDLYGFNAWFRMGNWIGQNIEALCDYVDVICPMFYPSHFPQEFQNGMTFLDRAEYIYREGTRRAQSIAGGRALVRPYVQAFLIGGETKFEEPVYSEYLFRQLTGARDSSGFTLWNASNRYYMVTKPLSGFAEAYRMRER